MTIFQLSLYSKLEKETAFHLFLHELDISLMKNNIQIDYSEGSEIVQRDSPVGLVRKIVPNKLLALDWKTLSIDKPMYITIEIRFEQHESGTIVILEPKNLIDQLETNDNNLLGWSIDEIFSPLLLKLGSHSIGDWLTDRGARRPTGSDSKAIYNNPQFHWPNFYFLLDHIHLSKDDFILEIGCGGGVLLKEFLKSGCKAKAIDHSPEMIKLAKEKNETSIAEGRVDIIYSSAEKLPFKGPTFTHVIMTGVFQFIKDPNKLLRDIHDILVPDGKLYMYGGSKEMKGTEAAPEPYASRLKFYDKEELVSLTKKSGFSEVEVSQPDLMDYAKKARIPDDYLSIFESKYSLFLVAKK